MLARIGRVGTLDHGRRDEIEDRIGKQIDNFATALNIDLRHIGEIGKGQIRVAPDKRNGIGRLTHTASTP